MAAGGKGKVHIKDVMDRTAESDPEYIKVVKELQEGNTRSALLIGRGGAFDRHDLQYLEDFKDAEKMKEEEIKHAEASEFAKLRSRLETSTSSDNPAALAGTLHVAVKERKELKPAAKLLPAVKVVNNRDGMPALKRARTGSAELHDDTLAQRTGSNPGNLPASRSGSLQSQYSMDAKTGKPASAEKEATVNKESRNDDEAIELQGLLGDYGSSDESEDDGKQKETVSRPTSGSGLLPSASELLADVVLPTRPSQPQGVTEVMVPEVQQESSGDGSSDEE